MSQFTSSSTADPSSAVVNAVLNTETNTITYTVTTTAGFTATTTAPASEEGNSVRILNAIRRQITAQTGDILATGRALNGFGDALNNVQVETTSQAATTPGTVQETKPIPTNNQADPAVAPAPNNTPIVENSSPAQVSPFNDPQQRAEAALAAQGDPNYIENFSPAPADEFAGIDAQVQNNIQNYAPEPIVVDELSAYPPNPVDQRSTEIDELSAYPRNPVDVAAEEQLLAGIGRTPGAALQGLTGAKLDTQSQATQQDAANSAAAADWRVRLSLAPGATYLYKDKGNEGILLPLAATNGVIFPYTPAIQVQYSATYDPNELTHSNYKFFSYRGSAVDTVSITCDFTAQDTKEANYLLAVIHFFRSVTKMFYGKDQTPRNGTPPPLCYLSGLGTYQFDKHPLAITGFTYTLPTDVDYIRAQSVSPPPGVSTAPSNVPSSNSLSISANRLFAAGMSPGALANPPVFNTAKSSKQEPTYVPTKISLTITAVPIVTRNDISNNFSLKEYGTGSLLRGTQRKSGGGIW